MAKLYCSEVAAEVCDNAVQVMGGHGLLQDFDMERFYRDQRILQIGEGTSEILRLVISRAIGLILNQYHEHHTLFLWMAAVSVFLCFLQFFVGHRIGKRYGDYVAGGQSLGQKNTVLAIWMAQSYLDPLCSIVPTLYVLWQNLYNSFQMMQKERRDTRRKQSSAR